MIDAVKKLEALEKKFQTYVDKDSLFKIKLDNRLNGLDKDIKRLRKGMPHINFEDDNA